MLEGQRYPASDMMFYFKCDFIDAVTGCIRSFQITNVNKMYSTLVHDTA